MARINKRVFGAEVSQDIIDELKKIEPKFKEDVLKVFNLK